jgi:tRNA pseudouridine38-40 synthase
MTGCLVDVGKGRLQPDDVRHILEAKDRSQAPQQAPAHGLFLVDVKHQGIQI